MIKTFIIHVSKGYEDRRQHIDTHLPQVGLTDYEYMLRGDIDDLSEEIRHEFFSNDLNLPQMSCLYKHYLVMKKVVDENIPLVLVLEDDALLVPDFVTKLNTYIEEVQGQQGFVVNIEEASNLVPFSVRKPNQNLYLCKTNKLTGGLLYDLEFAKRMVKYLESTVTNAPIDGLIGNERENLQYNIYWTHPPLVRQGSKTGLFASELSGRTAGLYATVRSWFKENYRTHVRSHLSNKQKALFQNIDKY
ncbi:3-deoxy-D-manno-octulosonic acid transferase [Vibrio sinensis]|uniref:3-deoxy-D-manno-octulosonic acid transferase n=1 Tax=Vibrio sinensis TaxID=2302434 RepID=A0A3A6QP68_9VIBR|nr:glycosyltransferase family 25 protein [Vibrio sinensis]RJX72396.1 3-deoxy-D-manno-octulosonic acid transferase [Vibrio sinensis]